ncbi:MAG: S8 family peptidase, partial [Phycisphaerales bacterium]
MTTTSRDGIRPGRLSSGFCSPPQPVELLEPRQMMAFAAFGPEPSLFSTLGVTTTGSSATLQAPFSSGVNLFDAFANASPGTAAARSLIGLDRFSSDARFRSITGSGFSTVILDTGIDLDHPFFGPDADGNGVADRIVYQYDFADNDADASDRNGHGSNVASIVGSSDALYPGIAPGSNLIVLKVFGDNGGGSFGTIERALQWVIANAARFNVASVNLSLGDSSNYTMQQQRYGIGDELAALAMQNIVTVAAAGNSFFDFGSQQGASYPAADPNVLAVGAVYAGGTGGFTYGGGARANSIGAGRLTPFSQRSTTIPTYFAPGAPITGAGPSGGTVTMHGTSQASPMLAGVVTLV